MRQKMKEKEYPKIEQNMIQRMKEQVKNKGNLLRTYRCSRKTMEKKKWERKLLKQHLRKFSTSERIHEHSNQKYTIKEKQDA